MEIPNKLHIDEIQDPKSPYYKSGLSHNIDIYLDGIRQDANVISYNIDDGCLTRYVANAYGKRKVDAWHQPIKETVYGKVSVKWRYEKESGENGK